MDFAFPSYHRVKKKKAKEKNRNLLGPCLRKKKAVKHEDYSDILIGELGKFLKGSEERLEGTGNLRKIRNPADHSIVEISQYTDENPGQYRQIVCT